MPVWRVRRISATPGLGRLTPSRGLARLVAACHLFPCPSRFCQRSDNPRPAMLPTIARRMAQAAKPHLEAATGPSKLKKVWPPDFSRLSPQEQLRFEKRYKRRIHHIAQRPRWNKMIQLAQLFTISCRISAIPSAVSILTSHQLSLSTVSFSWTGGTKNSLLMTYVVPHTPFYLFRSNVSSYRFESGSGSL